MATYCYEFSLTGTVTISADCLDDARAAASELLVDFGDTRGVTLATHNLVGPFEPDDYGAA